jgi:hypothetical protein
MKDPKEMTSPEKKRYAVTLFARSDKVGKQVNETIIKVKEVRKEMQKTIKESNDISKQYHDENDAVDKKLADTIEAHYRSQQAKYEKTRVVVEPNLSKRMEQRRENALRRANEKQLLEEEQLKLVHEHKKMQFEQAQQEAKIAEIEGKYMSAGQLEAVSEEAAKEKKPPMSEDKEPAKKLNADLQQLKRPDTAESRSSQVKKDVAVVSSIIVTPKVRDNSISDEQARNVLQRQLTMQFMPMYRARQRSAGLRPLNQV